MAIFSWASRLGLIAFVFTFAAAAQTSGNSQNPRATQPPATQSATPAPDLLIKNGTVLTVTHGVIQNGSVLVHNGKIAQIGANIAAPAGATVRHHPRLAASPPVWYTLKAARGREWGAPSRCVRVSPQTVSRKID